MTKIFVKHAKYGLVIPNPDDGHAPLSIEGALVENTTYWQRRIEDGDVVISQPPKQKKGEDQ